MELLGFTCQTIRGATVFLLQVRGKRSPLFPCYGIGFACIHTVVISCVMCVIVQVHVLFHVLVRHPAYKCISWQRSTYSFILRRVWLCELFHRATWWLRFVSLDVTYVSMCIYIYIYVHACMHGWMDGWMDRWMHGRMDGWTDGRMGGWADGRMDARVCIYIYTYIYVYIYMYMYIYIYIYMFTPPSMTRADRACHGRRTWNSKFPESLGLTNPKFQNPGA